MKIKLAYGKKGSEVSVPQDSIIIEPEFTNPVENENKAVREALRSPIKSAPLKQLVQPESTVIIVHSDITRATPNHIILPEIAKELEEAGVRRNNIRFLNALGTHRFQTKEELDKMLGTFITSNYECLQHDCFNDDNLEMIGTTSFGNPVRINKNYLEADIKILTGFIEPHFFAGFSGGPKGVLPSIAGIDSVMSNHGVKFIAHESATWGITAGNPIWEEMMEAALMTTPDFLVNVTLNKNKNITGVFAGDLQEAHKAGADFCRRSSMVPVNDRFDIVVTTNSGYPLDLNLYQAVKGMTAAAQIVKEGGAIIVAAECSDGIPDHGKFAELLKSAADYSDILKMVNQPGFESHDQWQVQILAMILKKADVFVYSTGLSDEQIKDCMLTPCNNIEETINMLMNKYDKASIAVMPEGPQTVPYIK